MPCRRDKKRAQIIFPKCDRSDLQSRYFDMGDDFPEFRVPPRDATTAPMSNAASNTAILSAPKSRTPSPIPPKTPPQINSCGQAESRTARQHLTKPFRLIEQQGALRRLSSETQNKKSANGRA